MRYRKLRSAFDSVGNRKSITSTLGAIPSAGTLYYDANDRTSTDTYDNNGNTVWNAGIENRYDFENHLVQHGDVTLTYDGDGNRVGETIGGVPTHYLVDEVNPTGYVQTLDELSSGSVIRNYTWGHWLLSEQQAVNGTWTSSFYGYDGHGSVRQLFDAAGAITDTYDYDAFGNLIGQAGSTPNVYLYSGEAYDQYLGLYYNRARYLDVRNGRFSSADTYEGIATAPSTLHRYTYVSNEPVTRIDPTGHAEFTLPGTTIAMADQQILQAMAVLTMTQVCVTLNSLAGPGRGPCFRRPDDKEARMRIQLQLGDQFTVPGTPVLTNTDPPGVTILQVRAGLETVFAIAQTAVAKFPFSSLQSDLVTAVVLVSQQAGTFAPWGWRLPTKSLLSAPVGNSGWRIDVDNLEGTNLRQ